MVLPGHAVECRLPRLACTAALLVFPFTCGWAQGNYEIQVYASELVPPHDTMFELHSNFTVEGSKTTTDGTLPTEHQEHETLEITHGVNEWFEMGLYQFTNHQPDGSWTWVGTHIRPRFAVPERYHLPFGLSLSNEIGYQRARISPDTWTWEIRPSIDKKLGRWYGSFNPTFDRSWHGPSVGRGFAFSPDLKVSYDVTPKVAAGFEYCWVRLPPSMRCATRSIRSSPPSTSTWTRGGNSISVWEWA
jgi:hypothetical protein